MPKTLEMKAGERVIRLTGSLARLVNEIDGKSAPHENIDITLVGDSFGVAGIINRLNEAFDSDIKATDMTDYVAEELEKESDAVNLHPSMKPLVRRILHDITGEDEDGNSPIEETKLRLMVRERNVARFESAMEYLVKTGRVIRTFGAKYQTPFYRLAI